MTLFTIRKEIKDKYPPLSYLPLITYLWLYLTAIETEVTEWYKEANYKISQTYILVRYKDVEYFKRFGGAK